MTIYTDPISENRALTNLGVDAIPTTSGDVIDAAAEDAWARNPTPSAWRWASRQFQPADAPILPAKIANEKYGIDGHLSFDSDTPEPVAAELRALKQAELYRKSILERGPTGLGRTAAELGTGFLSGALDPLNIASAFVPVVGPARYAMLLEQAASGLGRAGIRFAVGGLEGLAGAAMVEPLVYGAAQAEQADYHAVDSMLNLAFGAALGGGLHSGLGAAGDALARARGRDYGFTHQVDQHAQADLSGDMADPAYLTKSLQIWGMPGPDASALVRALAQSKPETREALLRAAIAHTAEDRPVAVRALAQMDPALRGEMLDVGWVVEAAEADPLGPMDAAVARISPQVMEDVLFKKGQAIITAEGDVLAEGNPYKRAMGGHEGAWGAVKLLVKHGEFSDKAGTSNQLHRDDILALPFVLRRFEPVPEMTRTDASGRINAQMWVAERSDGEWVRYVLNRSEDGDMVTASIHVLEDKNIKLSEKRVAPKASPGGLSDGDTKAGIAHRPAQADGATKPSYTRSTRSGQRHFNPHAPQAIFDAQGKRHRVRYELVEADDLTASHDDDLRVNPDFPAELQPRDRGRAAAEAQITDIAANFEPERLGASNEAATGAPVIDKHSNIVESGNGRVLAIRRIYARGDAAADAYRAFLTRQGFDARAFAHPVLVRRRLDELTPEERRSFTIAAQGAGVLDLSATERALADAGRLDSIMHLLGDDQGRIGDMGLARNSKFVRAFIEKLPQAEQGRMLTEAGELSQDGKRRIEAAVLARAYDDADLLGRMVETDDDNSRAIGNALLDAAPDWATMRAAAAKGEIHPGLDSTDELIAAVRAVRDARAAGRPLAEIRTQADLFGNGPDLEGRFLAILLRDDGDGKVRSASREAIAADLNRYVDQAMRSNPDPDMFGTKPPGAKELLDVLGRDMPDFRPGDETDMAASRALDDLLAERSRIDQLDDPALDGEVQSLIDAGDIPADAHDLIEVRELLDQGRADADAAEAAAICLSRGGG